MPALQDKTVLIIGQELRDRPCHRPGRQPGRRPGSRRRVSPGRPGEACRGTDIGIEHVDGTDQPSIAALAALTSGFLTGVSILVDGEHLV